MKVGDLVLPENDEEFLFSRPESMDEQIDDVELTWREVPGIIIEIIDFKPKRNYRRVRIIVGDAVGWTYSDYIYVVD